MSENYKYGDPFSVCFNILKMRYKDYDESITSKNFLYPTDKINLFINLESVFKNISMIPELEKKLVLQRDFRTILVSNILNLAAHYKRFFVSNGLDTKVYLYQTNFDSDYFPQFKYNDEYRTYYLVKYNSNPKFIYLTDSLKDDILPEVKTYCEFIPNVYYISAKNIEGSLVPYTIAKEDPTRKNLIVTGDIYESQYSFLPNFMVSCFHNGYNRNSVTSSLNSYLKEITKKEEKDIPESMVSIFQNYPFYCTLLSVIGNKIRSIDGVSGVKTMTLFKNIERGLKDNEIQINTSNPNLIGEVFHDDEVKSDFVNNFYCTSLLPMYEELTETDKKSIFYQRKDRIDVDSLIRLNQTEFVNHPLILEALTM